MMFPATDVNQHEPPPAAPRRRIPVWLRWAIPAVVVLLAGTGALAASIERSGKDLPPVREFETPGPASPLATPLLPVSHWEQAYLDTWANELKTSLPLSTSGDSWDQYNLSYSVDSNTAMFRATGETRFLDRALLYIDNVAGKAKVSSTMRTSQYRDKYLGWISNSKDVDTPGTEVPLYESYFWRYATTTLRAIHDNQTVYGDPKYRAEYDRLLDFAEVNIFEKWYKRGTDNLYRSETHMASHWALIAVNLAAITTDDKRRAQYQTVVDNIDLHLPNAQSSLRQQLIRSPVDGAAYFWSDEWGSFRRPGQDVSHGNGVMAYVVEAVALGKTWTPTDMARFAETLTSVLRPRADGTFPMYVDGSGTDNGWIADGFVKLGRTSPAVQQWLEKYPQVNDQFFANMALNVKLLG
jgi:hypothetical protein